MQAIFGILNVKAEHLFTFLLVTGHHAYWYTKNYMPQKFSFSKFRERLALELFASSI